MKTYTFQISHSKTGKTWRKGPFATIEADSPHEAWRKFHEFDRGVPDGFSVRCLDENHKEVGPDEGGKYQVWLYGMQGSDDFLAGKYDTLEDALDIIRKEWPYPTKLLQPNGERYDFTKLSEFRHPVIYKYMVLKEVEDKQAHQNILLKEIDKDPDLKFFLRSLKNYPRNYNDIVNCDDSERRIKQMEALFNLIHCGLIEFVDFYDGSGILDPKWRK